MTFFQVHTSIVQIGLNRFQCEILHTRLVLTREYSFSKMTQKSFKFGSADNIKFIELYRSYECLWNTENENYKNRDARNAALD